MGAFLWLWLCMMLFVLPEGQLPIRDTAGLRCEPCCRQTLLIWALISFKTAANLLKTPWSWSWTVQEASTVFLLEAFFRR